MKKRAEKVALALVGVSVIAGAVTVFLIAPIVILYKITTAI